MSHTNSWYRSEEIAPQVMSGMIELSQDRLSQVETVQVKLQQVKYGQVMYGQVKQWHFKQEKNLFNIKGLLPKKIH